MVRFTLTIQNAEKLDIAFKSWQGKLKDWRAVWPKVRQQLFRAENRQFSSHGALGVHGEWADLDPDYAERKAKKWPGKGILHASEALRQSLTEGSMDSVFESHPLSMKFGTSLKYAAYHQRGYAKSHLGSYGRLGRIADVAFGVPSETRSREDKSERVPARRPIDFTPEDHELVAKTMQRGASDAARRLGFRIAKGLGYGKIDPGFASRLGRSELTGVTDQASLSEALGVPLSSGM